MAEAAKPAKDDIDAYLDQLQSRIDSKDPKKQRAAKADQAVMGGAVANIANGLLMGGGDEAVAFARSLFGNTSYSDAVAQERASREKYAEAHPYLSTALEVGGSVPTMFIP